MTEKCLNDVAKASGVSRETIDKMADKLRRQSTKTGQTPIELAIAEGTTSVLEAVAVKKRIVLDILGQRTFIEKVKGLYDQGLSMKDSIWGTLGGLSQKNIKGAQDSVLSHIESLKLNDNMAIYGWVRRNPEIQKLVFGAWEAFRNPVERKQFIDRVGTEFVEIQKPDGEIGITKDIKATEFAEVLYKQIERRRLKLNEYGANIGKLIPWWPVKHDRDSIRIAGYDNWKQRVIADIDIEKTFPEFYREDFDPAVFGNEYIGMAPEEARSLLIENGLFEAYNTIISGRGLRKNLKDLTSDKFSRELASKFGHHRVIQWKDYDSFKRYASQGFASDNIVQATLQHLDYTANFEGMFKYLGPNPEKTIGQSIDRIADDLRELKPEGYEKQLSEIKTSGDFIRREGPIANLYSNLSREVDVPYNITSAKIWQGIRNTVTMAKLGASTIMSMADITTGVINLQDSGVNLLNAYTMELKRVFKKLNTEQTNLALGQLHGIGNGVSHRIGEPDAFTGNTSKLTQFFLRMTGLNWWTDTIRSGHTMNLSNILGDNSHLSFDKIPVKLKKIMDVHGWTSDQWNIIRESVSKLEDGNSYVLPENILNMPDERFDVLIADKLDAVEQRISNQKTKGGKKYTVEQKNFDFNIQKELIRTRAKEDLNLQTLSYFASETKFGILEPDEAIRARMNLGTRPGSVAGNVARNLGQFRTFQVGALDRVLGRIIKSEHSTIGAGLKDYKTYTHLASFIAQLTVLSYATTTIKSVLTGKEPADPTDPRTWNDAMAKSFGTFIYGDFMAGLFNDYGYSFPEIAAGPVYGGLMTDVGKVFYDMAQGDIKAGATFDRLLKNSPFANLIWTQAAMNYLIIYRIREILSPNSLYKKEKALKKRTGQEFIFPPSQLGF